MYTRTNENAQPTAPAAGSKTPTVVREDGTVYHDRQEFRPIERPFETKSGFVGARFVTSDKTHYARNGQNNVIQRVIPKVRGKAQRRQEKHERAIARRAR